MGRCTYILCWPDGSQTVLPLNYPRHLFPCSPNKIQNEHDQANPYSPSTQFLRGKNLGFHLTANSGGEDGRESRSPNKCGWRGINQRQTSRPFFWIPEKLLENRISFLLLKGIAQNGWDRIQIVINTHDKNINPSARQPSASQSQHQVPRVPWGQLFRHTTVREISGCSCASAHRVEAAGGYEINPWITSTQLSSFPPGNTG